MCVRAGGWAVGRVRVRGVNVVHCAGPPGPPVVRPAGDCVLLARAHGTAGAGCARGFTSRHTNTKKNSNDDECEWAAKMDARARSCVDLLVYACARASVPNAFERRCPLIGREAEVEGKNGCQDARPTLSVKLATASAVGRASNVQMAARAPYAFQFPLHAKCRIHYVNHKRRDSFRIRYSYEFIQ